VKMGKIRSQKQIGLGQ